MICTGNGVGYAWRFCVCLQKRLFLFFVGLNPIFAADF